MFLIAFEASSPGAASSISIIPSFSLSIFNSSPEQSIPWDITPLIFVFCIVILDFGMVLPIGAYIVSSPSLALVAPQTTSLISSPTSTLQTLSLSASGCFSADNTFPTKKPFRSFSGLITDSTSKPISVRLSVISSKEEFVSICSLSQDRVNFISLTPLIMLVYPRQRNHNVLTTLYHH